MGRNAKLKDIKSRMSKICRMSRIGKKTSVQEPGALFQLPTNPTDPSQPTRPTNKNLDLKRGNKMKALKRNEKFTIIELLIVMVIIMIISTILASAVHMAKEKAKRVNCSNNFKGCYTGLANKATDNNGKLPTSFGMDGVATLYSELSEHMETKAWMCPSAGRTPVTSGAFGRGTFYYMANYHWRGGPFRAVGRNTTYLFRAGNPSQMSLMQDRFEVLGATGASPRAQYNHGGDEDRFMISGWSFSYYYQDGGKESLGDGINNLTYDGAVDWHIRDNTEVTNEQGNLLYGIRSIPVHF